MMMALISLVLILSLVTDLSYCATCSATPDSQADCENLLIGQYYCTSPDIDTNSQTAIGCRSNGTVLVTCYTAPNVTCGNDTGYYTVDDIAFCKEESCRYVNSQRYDYFIAVALSLFLGMFGIDRFYLGYPAIGLLKLSTVGFFFIGQLVDFLLILVQAVGPSDRSEYYAPFYGPLLSPININNSYLEVTDQPCV